MTLPHDRVRRGFTLIELLVVLVIAGLALALVMPFFGKRAPGAALTVGISEIATALRDARSAAIADGRAIAFRGDGSGGYWLDRRYYPLGGSLRLAVAGGSRISFFPSGGSSGGLIFIDSAGGRREIRVDAITGRADVVR
jgi:general secretion pathway protein H